MISFDTKVRRVLIDTGAGRDILFYDCFKAMGLTDAHLTPTHIKLKGFTSHMVTAKGSIELSVTIGEGDTAKMAVIKFMVMDLNFS